MFRKSEPFSSEFPSISADGELINVKIANPWHLQNVKKSAPQRRYQNAASVGFCSIEDFKANKTITAKDLLPFYLRLPQAERELKAKSLKGE